jgi:glutamyl-tRNA(Gln) amidotransferase subunit E
VEKTEERGIRAPADFNPRREPALDFKDKPLQEMTRADYDAIGFISGLEQHQQLDTKSKLFCRCPAGRRATRVDAEVLRHMRPTLSELGEYDGTALMEFKTRKEILYLLERETVCTYEMDDTPPFGIDDEAVRISIELALLCNLNLVSELHVMRKQYLDGSIPTGFQRTVMIGLTGAIPFKVPELGVNRELSIRQLSLEEDSCREVSDRGHRVTFRTDRLGMPLSEMVTEPELVTPQELFHGGRLLAHIARATHKVRRGPGATRQDVNVSVAGGRRVEIKGVDYRGRLPLLVHNEGFRQLNLLRVKAEMERRGLTQEMFTLPAKGEAWDLTPRVVDVSSIVRKSTLQPAREAVERGEVACAIRLEGMQGLLGHRTQPGTEFFQEFTERVRVIACPSRFPYMTHSELGEGARIAYTPAVGSSGRGEILVSAAGGLGEREWSEINKAVGAGSGDVVVVVWMPREDAATAAREVLLRASDALAGIPSETRQAADDGTTGFERILPGPDRMYPDTDTPPLPIRDTTIAQVTAQIAVTPWEREDRYLALGLDQRMARALAFSTWKDLFDALAPAAGEPARRLAGALEKRIPFHLRKHRGSRPRYPRELPEASRLAPIVRALEKGEIRPEALVVAIDRVLEDPKRSVDGVLAQLRAKSGDEERIAVLAKAVVAEGRAMTDRDRDRSVLARWGVGPLMNEFRGRVAPERVKQALEEALGTEQTGSRRTRKKPRGKRPVTSSPDGVPESSSEPTHPGTKSRSASPEAQS